MKRLTASIMILVGAASFGLLSTIVKLAYRDGFTAAEVTSSFTLVGWGLLLLLNILHVRRIRDYSLWSLVKLVVSGIPSGLVGIFYYLSLQTITASLGVILLFQFVWMGMLVDWILERKAPTPNRWLALVCVLIGTVLAAGYQTLFTSSVDLIGVLLGLLAAICYTINIAVNGRVEVHVDSNIRSLCFVTGGAIITFIIFSPLPLFQGNVGITLWWWAFLLGLFGVVIPPYLFAKGMPVVGSALGTLLGSIELPVVIVVSSLLLQEYVDWLQWIGILLILFGVVVSDRALVVKLLRK